MPSSSIIDELLPNEIIGKDLFHYTSAEGLLGILSNKVIRCSHIFYLNDIEENLNGWQFFFEVLDAYSNDHSSAEKFRNEVQKYFSNYQELNQEQLSEKIFENMHKNRVYSFIFSLSLIEDDLNQWRSYAEEPFGFSICFNFDRDFWNRQSFFRDNENCNILLRQCIYDSKEKEVKINRLLDHHFEDFKSKKAGWQDELFSNMLNLSLFFKNEKFGAERECRLVVTTALDPYVQGEKEFSLLNMRKGKSYLIPFIELQNSSTNIKGITIGPTPFKGHSYSSLKMLRNSLDESFGHIAIRHSEVPYRSW